MRTLQSTKMTTRPNNKTVERMAGQRRRLRIRALLDSQPSLTFAFLPSLISVPSAQISVPCAFRSAAREISDMLFALHLPPRRR